MRNILTATWKRGGDGYVWPFGCVLGTATAAINIEGLWHSPTWGVNKRSF